LAASGCSSYTIDNPTTAANYVAYVPHVAEGIIAEARNEFVCMSGTQPGGEDLLFDSTEYQSIILMRRMLDMLNDGERTEVMVDRLNKTKTNKEFLASLKEG